MAMKDKTKENPSVQTTNPAIEKAVRILDLLTESDSPLNGAQISKALSLPRSSVHGLLNSLLNCGLIRKTENHTFTLGTHLMEWANGFLAKQDIVSIFQELIAQIPELTPYTLTLSTLTHDKVMYLACRNSSSPLGFTFRIGMQAPAVWTATGKAILSTFDNETVATIIKSFPEPMTNTSVQNLADLLKELDTTRQKGYAVDNGQLRLGMHCFGTAINSPQGEYYGIAISLTEQEADQDTIEFISRHLKSLARNIEYRLGSI